MATDVFFKDGSLKGIVFVQCNKLSKAFLMSTGYSILNDATFSFPDVYGVNSSSAKSLGNL